MNKKYYSIIFLLVVILFVIIIFLEKIFNESKQRIIAQYQSQQSVLVYQSIFSINSYLVERERAIEVLADFPASKNLEEKIFLTEYQRTFEKVGGYKSIIFVDKSGNVQISYPNLKSKKSNLFKDTISYGNLIEELNFVVKNKKSILSEAFLNESKEKIISILSPIIKNNLIVGFILAQIPVSSFLPKQVVPILFDFDGHIWIIQDNGEIIYHSVHNKNESINILKPEKYCFNCHINFESERNVLKSFTGNLVGTGRKDDQLTSFRTLSIPNINWKVAVSVSSEKLEKSINKIASDFTLFGVLIFITSLSLIVMFIFQTAKRNQAEIELKAQNEKIELENRYYSLVESIPDGIFVMKDFKFFLINNSMQNIFEYTRNEFLENKIDWNTIIHKQDINNFFEIIENIKPYSNKTETIELKAITKNGVVKDLLIVCYPAFINEQFVIQGIIKDISQIKKLEKEKKEKENLVLIGEMGARLAHEIKNPLASIQTGIQILRNKFKAQKEDEEFFNRIIEEIKRMDNTIKSILFFAKENQLLLSKVDLRKTINEIIKLNESLLIQKNINVKINFDDNFPLLNLDENKWKQIVWNLLNNSIQAIENNGEIIISLYIENQKAVIIFEDTGKGIPEENLNKIFNPFFSTKSQGTGLGLSIARSFIELHKGEISVTKSKSNGAKFKIELTIN